MREQRSVNRVSVVCVLLAVSLLSACRGSDPPTDVTSKEYRDVVAHFYVGLAALQTGEDARAEERLKRVTELAAGEPAAWANLGLLALRQKDFDAAFERLERARKLAPDSSETLVLLGLLEGNRGRYAEAIAHLKRGVELDPANLKARYALAQEIERQGGGDSDAEARRVLEQILDSEPDNLAVQLEVTRLAAKGGDAETLRRTVARVSDAAGAWPEEAREQLSALQSAAAGPNPKAAGARVAFLRNVLVRVPDYRESLARVKDPPEVVGEPIARFIKLPNPSPDPAPPDEGLSFAVEPLTVDPAARWNWVISLQLTAEGAPVIVMANDRELRVGDQATLDLPSGRGSAQPAMGGVAALDFNYDFKNDIAAAASGGFRLFQQAEGGKFTDVTSRLGLRAAITGGAYTGVWSADIESEGDLDIVLGPTAGPPVVLRNNGDGTFKETQPFSGISSLMGFVWADLDGDGDPDAAMTDAQGKLFVFENERAGQFRARAVPENIGPLADINTADTNADGKLDLILLQIDGAILAVSDKREGRDWELAEIYRSEASTSERARLLVADMDNNGGIDLITAGQSAGAVLLSDGQGKFKSVFTFDEHIHSVADVTGDGRIDLIGDSREQRAVRLVGRGTKNYHYQIVRPRAAASTGDQRINSFGVGGEMEARAGLLFQKQVITGPAVHFGLGDKTQSDVVRIVWPNGTVQAEYELAADESILTEQRLKGSCPWLFAYDGNQMSFVTDFIWRSPLGLRINAQDTANVAMTEDRVKIRGRQLAPRDGFYDLRITADLWETHFFDHVSLMVVDHPSGTEVFIDERFAIPPPKLDLYVTAPPRPILRAVDDLGNDVTDLVAARDDRYLDTFGRGAYQGVTRDHYVEIELAADVAAAGPLYLVAHGWIHPTDSSINVALGQGAHAPPRGLSLEVADAVGGWVVARPNLGFPAGKTKTILVDLDGLFRPGAPRKLRLRTNLEIYWDSIEWAARATGAEPKTLRLAPASAELRYRGFSVVNQADKSSPELPQYRVATTQPLWLDLVGYHTRFGDVMELLTTVDDRYVIMNAGDEMVLLFAEQPPPPAGWERDFVLIGDGWEKDGDYNTTFSKTVLPLPSHGQPDYTRPPGRLEDDPVYRRHAQDWQNYHTRYVTPERLRGALSSRKGR